MNRLSEVIMDREKGDETNNTGDGERRHDCGAEGCECEAAHIYEAVAYAAMVGVPGVGVLGGMPDGESKTVLPWATYKAAAVGPFAETVNAARQMARLATVDPLGIGCDPAASSASRLIPHLAAAASAARHAFRCGHEVVPLNDDEAKTIAPDDGPYLALRIPCLGGKTLIKATDYPGLEKAEKAVCDAAPREPMGTEPYRKPTHARSVDALDTKRDKAKD